jgi:divalent metal cation (Fe/Co/Zn/Cd) transporter
VQAGLVRHGRRLEYVTLGWNGIEAVVAVGSGAIAGSTALIGFGIDSLIEMSSGMLLLWRLQVGERGQAREQAALRLVGYSFLALAGYVAFESAESLIRKRAPEASWTGIGLAVLSLLVMPWLSVRKRRVASSLGSRALEADSRQSSLCAWLSAILLMGLSLNALWGWWWAAPVAGLVMTPIIVREGLVALRGEACRDCHA